jgi:ribosomal protein S18 acetylase RimI-like enzyme
MADLANIIWRSLSGSHARIASGTDRIRRYARGFPPLMGYADPSNPDFAAIAPYCSPGERFYCAEWRGPEPAGWKIEVDTTMCAMLWNGTPPDPAVSSAAVRLGLEHVPQMTALAALTRPGPFADRPMEIGEWYGILDGDRVVAIAGERLHEGKFREISGVCTLPEYQGRGYARLLTERVLLSQLARGLKPFLHVASANARARTLYGRMGFAEEREVPMRIISLSPGREPG